MQMMTIKQVTAAVMLIAYLIVLGLWLIGGLSDATGAVLIGGITIMMIVISFSRQRSGEKTAGE
jgi:hypothetical protein